MKASILKRLEVIEAQYRDEPLIVLASTDSGEEIKMAMRECLEREDVHFKKVIGGSSLKDLEALLAAQREEAFRQLEDGEEAFQQIEDPEEAFFRQLEEREEDLENE